MATQIVTKKDHHVFKLKLLSEQKGIVISDLPKNNDLMKSKEVCSMLGISSWVLKKMRLAGLLPNCKIHGTFSYNRTAVIKIWCASQLIRKRNKLITQKNTALWKSQK